MIDSVLIKVIGGNGGNGCISGRHEKHVAYGGPDGGDGGDGGSVIVISNANVNTLLRLRNKHLFKAGDGKNGLGGLKHGKRGESVVLEVPAGTELWIGGTESRLVGEVMMVGDRVDVAKGGRGGRGNARFTSSTNQFPLIAEAGEPGEKWNLRLELKVLADVGIIGAPNAGKSSLLAAVTAARPKIAEYPFTTLEPVLGAVEHRDRDFMMVDIPGLIEDAHTGSGLGHDFLRHVERTRVLVHVVDGSGDDPVGDYRIIRNELACFNRQLVEKPEIVAVNKVDLHGVEARCVELRTKLQDRKGQLHYISAVTRQGLGGLLDAVLDAVSGSSETRQVSAARLPQRRVPVIRPRLIDRPEKVSKEGGTYVVLMPAATRLAAMVDSSNSSAMAQLYYQLRRLGVVAELETAGIRPGETFRVGKLEWEWD